MANSTEVLPRSNAYQAQRVRLLEAWSSVCSSVCIVAPVYLLAAGFGRVAASSRHIDERVRHRRVVARTVGQNPAGALTLSLGLEERRKPGGGEMR